MKTKDEIKKALRIEIDALQVKYNTANGRNVYKLGKLIREKEYELLMIGQSQLTVSSIITWLSTEEDKSKTICFDGWGDNEVSTLRFAYKLGNSIALK